MAAYAACHDSYERLVGFNMDEHLLKSRILEYSDDNGYIAEHFAIARCVECECRTFKILMNEEEGRRIVHVLPDCQWSTDAHTRRNETLSESPNLQS